MIAQLFEKYTHQNIVIGFKLNNKLNAHLK